ncbi:MAG: exo-alpha-sialidase [Flavobacteriales bacterium]|nr:exo-alpha-sialidase [Flavobacteriales bacterium]
MNRVLSSLLVFFCTLGLKAQYRVVTIDDKTYLPNEPSIYISDVNPAIMVAGSNIKNHYHSSDSGKTWEIKSLYSGHGVYGDPVIYGDEYGNFYFCHLAATKTKKYPSWIDRIVVQKSSDGGVTFNNGCFAGFNGDKEQDKHWISKDKHSTLYKDNIYLTWTEFDKYDSKDTSDHSRIRFARSVDGAESFEEALTISDTTGDCLDGDNTLEGATTAIGANGEIYVCWSAFGKIYFDRSIDGGVTFGKDKVIAKQQQGWSLDFDKIYRSNGLPFLVADHSRGKYRNRLYLIWGEYDELAGGEVKLKYSDNGGATWSKDITVHSKTEGDQFLPHIAVDQTDGSVYVVYYDRRNSPGNVMMDVYVSYSFDGGQTFRDKRVTPNSFFPAGEEVFFGDYNGIAAHRGIVRPIWTSTTFHNDQTTIQTALLSKELLRSSSQILRDTLAIKFYQQPFKNQFVLYSSHKINYKLKLVVTKKGGLFGKHTYIEEGELDGVLKSETIINVKSGHKYKLSLIYTDKSGEHSIKEEW